MTWCTPPLRWKLVHCPCQNAAVKTVDNWLPSRDNSLPKAGRPKREKTWGLRWRRSDLACTCSLSSSRRPVSFKAPIRSCISVERSSNSFRNASPSCFLFARRSRSLFRLPRRARWSASGRLSCFSVANWFSAMAIRSTSCAIRSEAVASIFLYSSIRAARLLITSWLLFRAASRSSLRVWATRSRFPWVVFWIR